MNKIRVPRLGAGRAATAADVGLGLGGLELLVAAFTEERHQPGAVAWVLAALSAGSAVGGLANGAVSWRSAARPRLAVICAALAAAGLAPNVYALCAAATVAGLFVAPALITAFLIADEAAAPDARTQAGAWVNTSVNAGSSGGTALVGVLVGRVPLSLCFALLAIPALLCAAVTLRGTDRAAPVTHRTEGDSAGQPS